MPRVLFITSREQVRFDDGLGWSYLPTLDDLLAVPELPAPSGPLDLTAPGLPGATSTDPAAAAAPVSATE